MVEKFQNLLLKVNLKDTLIVLFIALILGSVAYAWFSATVSGNEDAKTYTVETATLGLDYTDGSTIEAKNILPGWTGTKTFSVTNTGDAKAIYKINWANITNTFKTKSDLVYSIASTNSGGTLSETQIPSTGENINILTNIEIGVGVTQTYTITFTYKNRNENQSDQGSTFLGKIEVLDIHS